MESAWGVWLHPRRAWRELAELRDECADKEEAESRIQGKYEEAKEVEQALREESAGRLREINRQKEIIVEQEEKIAKQRSEIRKLREELDERASMEEQISQFEERLGQIEEMKANYEKRIAQLSGRVCDLQEALSGPGASDLEEIDMRTGVQQKPIRRKKGVESEGDWLTPLPEL